METFSALLALCVPPTPNPHPVNELIAKHLEGSEHSLWEEYKQGDHVVITLSS